MFSAGVTARRQIKIQFQLVLRCSVLRVAGTTQQEFLFFIIYLKRHHHPPHLATMQ
jgi:hypothetical protein